MYIIPHGKVMTGLSVNDQTKLGMFMAVAVPDAKLRDDWKEAPPTKEEFTELLNGQGPLHIMVFDSVEALDRVRNQLDELRFEMLKLEETSSD